MKIAVTGAGGLVGTHIVEQLGRNHEVLALSHTDLDIIDRKAVHRWSEEERPQLIINCAVIGVDECERDEKAAWAVNVDGPRALAEAAEKLNASLLHFSSNYVFSGEEGRNKPYTQNDETRPVNIYGQTKLAGEKAVLSSTSQSYIVRTSWVYGRGKDSFLASAYQNLRSGKRIRAIFDTWASTTYVGDLVSRIEEIIRHHRFGIYHVVNDGICSYYDFAVVCAQLAELSSEEAGQLIEIVREEEMGRVARRPRYTPMRCLLSEEVGLAPLRDWREALADYVR